MSVFSDVDIKKALGKDIVIEPFQESSLTPIGYDFSVGEFVFCLEHGLLEEKDGAFEIPPRSTVQILTRESLWVSGRIGGTFHSKVSLVSRGLSHISTTLDPGWYGPLLITFSNNTDKSQKISVSDSFVTLIFFNVKSPTKRKHFKPEFRTDILISQLDDQTMKYISKIKSIAGNPAILQSFEDKVQTANQSTRQKVAASLRSKEIREILKLCFKIATLLMLPIVACLGLIWDYVKPWFGNVAYDSDIIAAQFGMIIMLMLAYSSTDKRQ